MDKIILPYNLPNNTSEQLSYLAEILDIPYGLVVNGGQQ